MLIIYLYCVLFALQLGLLIYCSLKKSKRMWICQLVFQGLRTALAAGLCIYYECLPVYPGPILSLHMEGFISLFAQLSLRYYSVWDFWFLAYKQIRNKNKNNSRRIYLRESLHLSNYRYLEVETLTPGPMVEATVQERMY